MNIIMEMLCFMCLNYTISSMLLHLKKQIDFLKIKDGIWGAINFNNMIPVPLVA